MAVLLCCAVRQLLGSVIHHTAHHPVHVGVSACGLPAAVQLCAARPIDAASYGLLLTEQVVLTACMPLWLAISPLSLLLLQLGYATGVETLFGQ